MRRVGTDARADQRHMWFFFWPKGKSSHTNANNKNRGGESRGQARIQNFLKGGGGEDIHKHPPPHLDIARVTSPRNN